MRHITRPTKRPDDYDCIPYRLGNVDADLVWVHYGACKEERVIGYTQADGREISAMLAYIPSGESVPREYLITEGAGTADSINMDDL